jgi:hypothetical protein
MFTFCSNTAEWTQVEINVEDPLFKAYKKLLYYDFVVFSGRLPRFIYGREILSTMPNDIFERTIGRF